MSSSCQYNYYLINSIQQVLVLMSVHSLCCQACWARGTEVTGKVMATTLCKLYLLSLALFTSVLSIGCSFLLLLARGSHLGSHDQVVAVHTSSKLNIDQFPQKHRDLIWFDSNRKSMHSRNLRFQIDGRHNDNDGEPVQRQDEGNSSEWIVSLSWKNETFIETTQRITNSTAENPRFVSMSPLNANERQEDKKQSKSTYYEQKLENSFTFRKKYRVFSKRLRQLRLLERHNITVNYQPPSMNTIRRRLGQDLPKQYSTDKGRRGTISLKRVPQLPLTRPQIPVCTASPPCISYLSEQERAVYHECWKKATKWLGERRGTSCQCSFINGTGMPSVALVSLPGSGNTWLRGLLEKATGICSGSVFCDKVLRAGGMCGEGIRGGSVLVTKTHDTKLQWTGLHYRNGIWSEKRPFHDAAIVLIRNPFRAVISEWNRQNAKKITDQQKKTSHTKFLDKPIFFCKYLNGN